MPGPREREERLGHAVLASCLLIMMAIGPALADPVTPSQIRVVDGDTIHVAGQHRDSRLVGFKAPGMGRSQCRAERALGYKAARRLRELVAAGRLDLEYIACSCPAGTEGKSRCNKGRSCAILKSAGRDVGEILVEDKLAVPFRCGKTECPKTPRPWCNV